jgi:indolepyruvate ferredoxin oxidoreductase
VVHLAQLPDVVRGYEHIKMANVERFRSEAAQLLATLGVSGDGAAGAPRGAR